MAKRKVNAAQAPMTFLAHTKRSKTGERFDALRKKLSAKMCVGLTQVQVIEYLLNFYDENVNAK